MSERSFDPALPSIAAYKAARERIVAAREGFFSAVREYLRPESRVNARDLNDALWNSEARNISDEDWVVDAARGQLTIRESFSRPFRISVLQMGYVLRVGVRLQQSAASLGPAVASRLASTFPGKAPAEMVLTHGGLLLDWSFEIPDLYDSAMSMETGVHFINSVLENALQAIVASREENTPPAFVADEWETE